MSPIYPQDRQLDVQAVESVKETKPMYCPFCSIYLGKIIGRKLIKDGEVVLKPHKCRRR